MRPIEIGRCPSCKKMLSAIFDKAVRVTSMPEPIILILCTKCHAIIGIVNTVRYEPELEPEQYEE